MLVIPLAISLGAIGSGVLVAALRAERREEPNATQVTVLAMALIVLAAALLVGGLAGV